MHSVFAHAHVHKKFGGSPSNPCGERGYGYRARGKKLEVVAFCSIEVWLCYG